METGGMKNKRLIGDFFNSPTVTYYELEPQNKW